MVTGRPRLRRPAPDDTTISYIAGRPFAPSGAAWDAAVASWRGLPTDAGAAYDATVTLDANELTPMITYGTNPGMGMSITSRVPDPADAVDAWLAVRREAGRAFWRVARLGAPGSWRDLEARLR